MPSQKQLIYFIYFILNPWLLAPLVAYLVSSLRHGYQRPEWMSLYIKVQAFDLIQGLIFSGMAAFHVNNQWLRHFTQPLVFVGMLGTLFKMAPDAPGRRQIYWICLALGIATAFSGAVLDGMHWRNSIFTSTMCLIYLALVTQEFKALTLSFDDANLTSLPGFWILAALLVYSSGTLIFNASSNYFLRTLPPHLLLVPWVVVSLVHAIHEVLLAKAFLCPKPTSS